MQKITVYLDADQLIVLEQARGDMKMSAYIRTALQQYVEQQGHEWPGRTL